jgi:hypothetical protein
MMQSGLFPKNNGQITGPPGCERILARVSASSKGYERKQKGNLQGVLYRFHDRIKLQNRFFGCHETSNTQIWILCPL